LTNQIIAAGGGVVDEAEKQLDEDIKKQQLDTAKLQAEAAKAQADYFRMMIAAMPK
jgi:hypothetical protein